MNTASAPVPEQFSRNRTEPVTPLDQPLPVKRVTHLESVLWSGLSPVPASPPEPGLCSHWPLDGAAHIQAAARVLRLVAQSWFVEGLPSVPRSRKAGCIDLDLLAGAPCGTPPLDGAASFPTQLHAQKLGLRALADDYATVAGWLCGAAGSSWDAAKKVRESLGLVIAPGESHRVIARDWLAADMNALIATVLRRAVGMLDRLELTADATEADLSGRAVAGRILRETAEMLDRAATLACDAARFVEQIDQRWQQFRSEVTEPAALASDPGVYRLHNP